MANGNADSPARDRFVAPSPSSPQLALARKEAETAGAHASEELELAQDRLERAEKLQHMSSRQEADAKAQAMVVSRER